MSFVVVSPEFVSTAASDLAKLGATISEANAFASAPTTSLLAAGADEVSAAVAALFAAHGSEYQAISAQIASFHDSFVQQLNGAGASYAAAEATSASPLQVVEQTVLNAINTPTQLLLGRPLIGNGADGAPGTGQAGQAGGILWGNGGNGG
ncbi:hypothetical protein BV508_30945, partial [Mycobacterium intermedium]